MSRIELKAGHTLVLCRLAAASEGLNFSELTERCGLDPSAALCGCRIVARNAYMPSGAVSVARNLPGAVKTAPYKPF